MKKKLTLFNIALTLIVLMILAMAGLLVFMKPGGKSYHSRVLNDTITEEPHPVFRKDASLSFTRESKNIVSIDVEIADDEPERVRGLMYRDSMSVNRGMLFIFPAQEPMAFWMKNTRFSLDIIYVNGDKRIVDIAKNTTPYSLTQIPSRLPAQYVVEVNAGFVEKFGLREGDFIEF